MNSAIFIIAVIVAILTALASWDKVIYEGPASISPNDTVHSDVHHKAVTVVSHKELKPGANLLFAVVSNAKADAISMNPGATHQIIIRQRLFQNPRVTHIS